MTTDATPDIYDLDDTIDRISDAGAAPEWAVKMARNLLDVAFSLDEGNETDAVEIDRLCRAVQTIIDHI